MTNNGNGTPHSLWFVLLILCLFASVTIELANLAENEALVADIQPISGESVASAENEAGGQRLTDVFKTRLSAGKRLSGTRIENSQQIISDAYPPDAVHGPPVLRATTV